MVRMWTFRTSACHKTSKCLKLGQLHKEFQKSVEKIVPVADSDSQLCYIISLFFPAMWIYQKKKCVHGKTPHCGLHEIWKKKFFKMILLCGFWLEPHSVKPVQQDWNFHCCNTDFSAWPESLQWYKQWMLLYLESLGGEEMTHWISFWGQSVYCLSVYLLWIIICA